MDHAQEVSILKALMKQLDEGKTSMRAFSIVCQRKIMSVRSGREGMGAFFVVTLS